MPTANGVMMPVAGADPGPKLVAVVGGAANGVIVPVALAEATPP